MVAAQLFMEEMSRGFAEALSVLKTEVGARMRSETIHTSLVRPLDRFLVI